ncbi:MAG: hypothetical protein OXC29_23235 [Rhodococcus sp.]|nr:hypothetical protein [Rhodococcus sp. (in: high G+C Gram-positive bacteria)]
MDLLTVLFRLLRGMDEVHVVNDLSKLKTVTKPAVAVTYEGTQRSSHSNNWATNCAVHLFLGPAYTPDVELAVAATAELIRDTLLTVDGVEFEDWLREAEEQLAQVPFVHLSISVYEVAG